MDKNNNTMKSIILNERLIERLIETNNLDKMELDYLKSKIKENKNSSAMILTIGLVGGAVGASIIGIGEYISNSQILLSSMYMTFMATISAANAIVPLSGLKNYKKDINGIVERIAAEDMQIKKLRSINLSLKEKIDKEELSNVIDTIEDKKELENLKKYLEVISFYGSNKESILKLYEKTKLTSFLKRKGYDSKSIEYLHKYISEEKYYAYNANNLEENIFEDKPYTLKYM